MLRGQRNIHHPFCPLSYLNLQLCGALEECGNKRIGLRECEAGPSRGKFDPGPEECELQHPWM